MSFTAVFWLTTMVVSASPQTSPRPSIVPAPVEMRVEPGSFAITSETAVAADAGARAEAARMIDSFAPALGFRPRLADPAGRENRIVLEIGTQERFGAEGYRLEIRPEQVRIEAAAPAGLFYGVQTLRQLLPPAVLGRTAVADARWSVPCVTIEDRPRFAWRGLLLDPARYFIPKEFVLKFIDTMALHKFNRLQLHLTDDQGWRIEIKKYPKLTEVGAWRAETVIGHAGRDKPLKFDGKRHGGFYTQADIREIVRYAAERHITVVPEIEMPGHARAAISAYPELGCNPDQRLEVGTVWGVCPDIFAPTDKTVVFLQDVLAEVLELFPSTFIHIGGDEAIKDQWKASPMIQARIKELGLKDEAELQSWFVRRMDAFLTARGRRLVGWDEILEGGLAPGAVVMSWRGEAGGIAAAKSGHDVIMAPTTYTYIDYYQGDPAHEPLAIGGMITLEKVYAYEPIPKELTGEEAHRVLGGQGQLWAEYLPNPKHVEYMAFPRAAALAEVLWSQPANRDYQEFLSRLREHLKRLDELGVNYRRLDP